MFRNLMTARTGIVVMILTTILYASCRKPAVPQATMPDKVNAMNSAVAGTIPLWEVYRKLPQIIAFNLADSIGLDTSRVEWIYRQTGLLARIPTTSSTRNWIYVFQPYDAPADLKVYAVKFIQESGTSTSFTGKQVWINLQDWQGYGVSYTNNIPTAFLQPQPIFEPDWETCMMNNGYFFLDNQGKIAFADEQLPGTVMRPTGGNDGCGGPISHKSKKSIWDMLGGFFRSIFTGSGNGHYEGGFGSAPGVWIPPNGIGDDGYGGGGGGGSSPYEPPPSGPEITPVPPDQAGSSFNTIDNPGQTVPALWNIEGPFTTNGNASQVLAIENATVAFVGGVLGLNQNQRNWLLLHLDKAAAIQVFLLTNVPDLTDEEKKNTAREHIKMMMENPDYLTAINNLTGNWWDLDMNDFMKAKKIMLELYLQANPYGMIDCDKLSSLPMNMYQQVGSYAVPQSVLGHLDDIRNAQPGTSYSSQYFDVQDINGAGGSIVNCDYFAVHINQLPEYTNGTQMTPDQFLEYFRTHINSFTGQPSDGAQFSPYQHVASYLSGTVNVNEETRFNTPYEGSLGALIHIHIPVANVLIFSATNNGSVVQSGYTRETPINRHWFMFTTMKTPLDGEHPVAGNRKFGIFPDPNGGYCFYTMGVDRFQDASISALDWGSTSSNQAFAGGDALWTGMQTKTAANVNNWQGSATPYAPTIIRPEWDKVADFLTGHRTLAELKADLNCP